jgi:hypothetical protein
MSRSMPVENVSGDPNSADIAKTPSHTEMIAVRLENIDMVVTLSIRSRYGGGA